MNSTAREIVCSLAVLFVCFVVSGFADRTKRDAPWRVTTLEEAPYSIKTKDPPTTNDDYDGYIPDLLKELGKHLKHEYTISFVPDGRYGAKEEGRWSGMIGELEKGTADIAAAAITVSNDRKEVVDFTRAFMTFDTVILMKKDNPMKIKSIKDLAGMQDVNVGILKRGTTYRLVMNSTDPNFKTVTRMIESNPANLVSSVKEGVEMIRNSKDGKFVFIMESNSGDYWATHEPCDLEAVQVQLQPREYALAVKKGSPLKDLLDGAIAELENKKVLADLKKKRWDNQCGSTGTRIYWSAVPLVFVSLLYTSLTV